MNLQWIHYEHDAKKSYTLYLVLGTRGNKLCALKAALIDERIVVLVRRNLETLSTLDIAELIVWFRERLVNFSKIYREIHMNRITIEQSYEIGVS